MPQRRRFVFVSHTSQINPTEFVERVQPLLERQDFQGLLQLLRRHWSSDQIKELLSCKCGDARKVATLALGLVGARCCIPSLATQLQDPDWSIWFRCGSEDANALLTRGAAAMDAREFESAEKLFGQAIEADPAFAEAYHQRAIVRYLTERFDESVADCNEVVKRMPCHFGAWAGMGHAHAHLGQLPDAIRCYVKALKINPHLDCLDECVKELRKQLKHPHCGDNFD